MKKFSFSKWKNLIFIISILVILFSCSKESKNANIDKKLPDCLKEVVKNRDSRRELKRIKVQEVNSELHYWLNTDASQSDGVEFIVNTNCDTICTFCGECFPPECTTIYNYEEWITIWKK